MSTIRDEDFQREIQAKLQALPPADWVRKMIDHYQRTGSYRPEDLRRLLGDPNRGVGIEPNIKLRSFFSQETDE